MLIIEIFSKFSIKNKNKIKKKHKKIIYIYKLFFI